MKAAPENHLVDIWYEAVRIDTKALDAERELLAARRLKLEPGSLEARTPLSVSEKWEGQPHRFFFFKVEGKTIVGQKLLSPIVTEHGSPGFFCSLIKPEMILGELIRPQTSQEGVKVHYQPLVAEARLRLFNRLLNDRQMDVYYPFNQMSANDRLEVNTPPEGWFITEERAEILGQGEVHFRAVSARMVKDDGLKAPVVYDPACSTGQFLSAIKAAVPSAVVIGQDLSAQMCAYARPKLDQVIVGNSLEPGVQDESCDYVFFRFLNSEVVTTALAETLFERLVRCLKPGGKAILFGHTPVLVSASVMERSGLKILQVNERHPSEDAVFQYYVLQRTK